MKTLISILLASTMIIGSAMAQVQQKVATVDLKKAFNTLQATTAPQAEIKKSQDAISKGNNDKIKVIRALNDDLNKLNTKIKDPATSDKEKAQLLEDRAELLKKGNALENERKQWVKDGNKAIIQDIAKTMQGMIKQLQSKVSKVAQAKGYTLVLDSSGSSNSQTPIVLFSDETIDITDLVIKEINKAK